jgi:hypothetical protein
LDLEHITTLRGYIHISWYAGLESNDPQDGKEDCMEQHLATLVREPVLDVHGSIDCQSIQAQ